MVKYRLKGVSNHFNIREFSIVSLISYFGRLSPLESASIMERLLMYRQTLPAAYYGRFRTLRSWPFLTGRGPYSGRFDTKDSLSGAANSF